MGVGAAAWASAASSAWSIQVECSNEALKRPIVLGHYSQPLGTAHPASLDVHLSPHGNPFAVHVHCSDPLVDDEFGGRAQLGADCTLEGCRTGLGLDDNGCGNGRRKDPDLWIQSFGPPHACMHDQRLAMLSSAYL